MENDEMVYSVTAQGLCPNLLTFETNVVRSRRRRQRDRIVFAECICSSVENDRNSAHLTPLQRKGENTELPCNGIRASTIEWSTCRPEKGLSISELSSRHQSRSQRSNTRWKALDEIYKFHFLLVTKLSKLTKIKLNSLNISSEKCL